MRKTAAMWHRQQTTLILFGLLTYCAFHEGNKLRWMSGGRPAKFRRNLKRVVTKTTEKIWGMFTKIYRHILIFFKQNNSGQFSDNLYAFLSASQACWLSQKAFLTEGVQVIDTHFIKTLFLRVFCSSHETAGDQGALTIAPCPHLLICLLTWPAKGAVTTEGRGWANIYRDW